MGQIPFDKYSIFITFVDTITKDPQGGYHAKRYKYNISEFT